ncbi:hypothetical protein ACJIZ3_010286 [Penstemon smallii]|uniref:NHL repeat-containing protein n=1 Tax=Penstemon smallii TaxID=265156 RepID=A0ABD3TEW8_9LAMI
MASPTILPSLFLLSFLFQQTLTQAGGSGGGGLIFEDGYTVSTVFDGDKSNFKVNPHSILHQSSPSDQLFVLLDSVASTFYTVSLPTTSNKSEIQRLAGNGEPNYIDGDLGSASFNKPRSFAVDYKGNVYVADQRNHAIRKISKSGVTTIAGGYSQKAGRTDGPARDASFSDDFELTFVPERCALMISDHGNRLVRQVNLKSEDCTRHSGSVLGTTSAWLLGLAFSCLLSLIVGFVIRPYVLPHEGFQPLHFNGTWKHCLMSLERQIMIRCSDIRNAVVKSTLYSLFWQLIILSLSHLSLMFRFRKVETRKRIEKPVSLLDCDVVSSDNIAISPKVYGQLMDLLTYDGGLILPGTAEGVVVQAEERGSTDVTSGEIRGIDSMIEANLINFEEEVPRVCSMESIDFSLGLVKRR